MSNLCQSALWVFIVWLIVCVWAGALEIDMLLGAYGDITTTAEDIAQNRARQNWVRSGYLLVSIIAFVVYLMWIYSATKAAARQCTEEMEFSPVWSVAWYLIPFANLIKPYEAMKELYIVSRQRTDWREASGSRFLSVWWGLWLFNLAVGQLLLRFLDPEKLDEVLLLSAGVFVSDMIEIVFVGMTLRLVRDITEGHTDLRRGMSSVA